MSFVTQEDILNLFEGMICAVFKASIGVELPRPFPRMEYADAMLNYGSLLTTPETQTHPHARTPAGVVGAGGRFHPREPWQGIVCLF
jgi:hypothetical protein